MKIILLSLIILFFLVVGFAVKANSYSQSIENLKSSATTKTFFNKAYGYVVYPTISKGGLGIDATHGKGIVFLNNNKVGKTSMIQFSAKASTLALTVSVQAKAGSSGISTSQGIDEDSTKQNKFKYHQGMVVIMLAKGE